MTGGAFVLRSPRILYKGGKSQILGVWEMSAAATVRNTSDAI